MKELNLRMEMNRRELTISEILQQSFGLLKGKFQAYLYLTLIVFIPTNIVSEIIYMMVSDATETDEIMIYYLVQAALSLIAMVSMISVYYILEDQLDHTNRYTFMRAFTEGLKRWPGYLLTLIMCMIPAILAVYLVLMIGVLISILLVPAITILIIALVIAQLYVYGIAIACADRNLKLGANVRYVNETYKNHVGKSIGIMLLLNLVSMVILYPGNLILQLVTYAIPNDIAVIVISVVIDTLLSVVNMYIGIGMILRFVNLNALKHAQDVQMLP